MYDEVDERPVVEARALQMPVVEQEPQRLDEMESQAGSGRQARRTAGVVRDFGMDEDQLHDDDDSGSPLRCCRFSNSVTLRPPRTIYSGSCGCDRVCSGERDGIESP